MDAVQARVVPVLVVLKAASPVGTLGAAAQVGVVVLLLLPPQAAISNKAVSVRPSIRKPNILFRRDREEESPIPTRDRPAIGSHIA